MFSVVNEVLLRAMPFPHPERLVRVAFTQQGHPDVSTPMDLFDYRTQAKSFTGFSVIEAAPVEWFGWSRSDGAAEWRSLAVSHAAIGGFP